MMKCKSNKKNPLIFYLMLSIMMIIAMTPMSATPAYAAGPIPEPDETYAADNI